MPEIPVPKLDEKPAVASSTPATQEPSTPAAPSPADAPVASSATQDAPAAPSPAPDVTPAPSAEPSDKSELLKAVTKAVKTPETQPEAKAPEQAQAETDADGEPDLPAEPTTDEMKTYSRGAQNRIRKLIGERNAAYERVAEIEPFREYMAENQLSGEDLAFSLNALATLRSGDYEGFLQQVQPFVQMALEYTGRAIAPDLQAQVRAGKMSQEVATAVQRQRYDLGETQQRLERAETQSQHNAEEQARSNNRSAVQVWETQTKANDPDYARKLDVAKAFVASIRAERGEPRSPDEAVAIAREAYDRASAALKSAMPSRAPTPSNPSGFRNAPSSGAVAAPNSLMEAAMRGLDNARRAS